jgi:TorA maturation chaperone TorD
MTETARDMTVAEEDLLRAELYDFLGLLLARPPEAALLARTAALTGDGSPLGQAVSDLAARAARTTEPAAEREYTRLFIGIGRGELLPYASYYMTGFLNEKPLAKLRDDMARLRIARTEAVSEPEDHVASLCEMMGGLIVGRFGAPASLEAQREFHAKHVAPWAGHFFSDLTSAQSAEFYGAVGAVGRAFMDIEREAFRLGAAPQPRMNEGRA